MEDSIKTPKLLLLRPSSMLCNDLFPKPEKNNFAYRFINNSGPMLAIEDLKSEELVVPLEK